MKKTSASKKLAAKIKVARAKLKQMEKALKEALMKEKASKGKEKGKGKSQAKGKGRGRPKKKRAVATRQSKTPVTETVAQ